MNTDQLEYQSIEEQTAYQIKSLQQLKKYLLQHSAFYQQAWQQKECTTVDINQIEDLQLFPCTTKDDIHNFESAFACIPPSQFRELNSTSGTSGAPITIALSDSDLDRLAYNEALTFQKLAIDKGERVQLMLTLDRLFMAGMSYYAGLKQCGATIIRTGAGLPQLQWDAILKYQPTTLVAVPSFLIKMIQFAQENGIDYQKSSVTKVLAIGESLKNENLEYNSLHHQIKSQWDIQLFNTYASTEMQTAFTECTCNRGGHQNTELLVVEIIDEHNRQVSPGTVGEVCVTTLGVEGMPLWRYKTGDLARMYYEPCACGRLSPRISGIVGRKNHMLKLKGTTIYPNAIFEALHQYTGVNDYLVKVSSNALEQDELHIYIHSPLNNDLTFTQGLSEHLRGKLKILPKLVFISEKELKSMQFPDLSRKQIKFVDCR